MLPEGSGAALRRRCKAAIAASLAAPRMPPTQRHPGHKVLSTEKIGGSKVGITIFSCLFS